MVEVAMEEARDAIWLLLRPWVAELLSMEEAREAARLAAAEELDSKVLEAVLTAAEAMEEAREDSSELLIDWLAPEALRIDLMDWEPAALASVSEPPDS